MGLVIRTPVQVNSSFPICEGYTPSLGTGLLIAPLSSSEVAVSESQHGLGKAVKWLLVVSPLFTSNMLVDSEVRSFGCGISHYCLYSGNLDFAYVSRQQRPLFLLVINIAALLNLGDAYIRVSAQSQVGRRPSQLESVSALYFLIIDWLCYQRFVG